MEYLWVLGITELQLLFFEVTTDGFFSAADATCSQAGLRGDGPMGFAVSEAAEEEECLCKTCARTEHQLCGTNPG